MTHPDHMIKQLHKDFLAWKWGGETKEKIDWLDQDPEVLIEYRKKSSRYA